MLDKTKNYKIDVSALSTAERTKLQEQLFLFGYKWWIDGGQKVSELDQDFLFLYDNMDIACGNERHCFNRHSNIPITAEDILLNPNLTPAQENAYKGSPSDSKTGKVYGVVGDTKDAVQPVFHIGDKIRFKSTRTIERIHHITHGGRFINSVNVEDVELVKEK